MDRTIQRCWKSSTTSSCNRIITKRITTRLIHQTTITRKFSSSFQATHSKSTTRMTNRYTPKKNLKSQVNNKSYSQLKTLNMQAFQAKGVSDQSISLNTKRMDNSMLSSASAKKALKETNRYNISLMKRTFLEQYVRKNFVSTSRSQCRIKSFCI